MIQPALEIGEEDDEYEQEANSVADKVMCMTEPGNENKRMHTGTASIQKMSTSEQKGMTAPPRVEQGIYSSKGRGQHLQAEMQQEMSSKIAGDFSEVNVHTDDNAVQMSQEIGAKAFTHGNDIYFNQGQYNPSSHAGKHLLAHELTHTMQQGGNIQKKIQRATAFPYDAEIATMYNTPLYSKASTTSERIIDLDRGTKIQVLAEEGDFYKVKVADKTGYVTKNNVAGSIVGEMEKEQSAGTHMKWQSSMAGTRPDSESTRFPEGKPVNPNTSGFSYWATGEQYARKPDFDLYPNYGWSCWEMILQFAMNSGRVKESFIHRIYQTPWPQKTLDKINSKDPDTKKAGIKEGKIFLNKLIVNSLKAKGSFEQTYSADNRPKSGDLVMFDGTTHVAIATGKYPGGETEVLSFWSNESNGSVDQIQKTTVEDLSPIVLKSTNQTLKRAGMDEVKKIAITWVIPPWVDETVK